MPARVFSVSSQGSLAVLTDLPSGPLLDGLLPGNLSLLASPEDPLALAAFVHALKPLDPPGPEAYATVQRWVLVSFVIHQAGSVMGAWGGGVIFDMFHNYDLAWRVGVLIGIIAGLVQIAFGGPVLPTHRIRRSLATG